MVVSMESKSEVELLPSAAATAGEERVALEEPTIGLHKVKNQIVGGETGKTKMLVSQSSSVALDEGELAGADGRANMSVDGDADLELEEQHDQQLFMHLNQQQRQRCDQSAVDPLLARMRDIVEGPSRSQQLVGASTVSKPTQSSSDSLNQQQQNAKILPADSDSGNQKRSRHSRHCQLRHHHHHHHQHQHRVSLAQVDGGANQQAAQVSSSVEQQAGHQHGHHHHHHHHHKCGAHKRAASNIANRQVSVASQAQAPAASDSNQQVAGEPSKSSSSSISSAQQQQQQVASDLTAKNESSTSENKEQRCLRHSCAGHHHHHHHVHHRHGHHRHAPHHHHHSHSHQQQHQQQHQHKKRPLAIAGDSGRPAESQQSGGDLTIGTGSPSGPTAESSSRLPLQEMQLVTLDGKSCCESDSHQGTCSRSSVLVGTGTGSQPQGRGNHPHHHHHHHHHHHRHHHHSHHTTQVHSQQQQQQSQVNLDMGEQTTARRQHHHNHHQHHHHQHHHHRQRQQRKHKSASSSSALNQESPTPGEHLDKLSKEANQEEQVNGALTNEEQVVSMDMSPQAGALKPAQECFHLKEELGTHQASNLIIPATEQTGQSERLENQAALTGTNNCTITPTEQHQLVSRHFQFNQNSGSKQMGQVHELNNANLPINSCPPASAINQHQPQQTSSEKVPTDSNSLLIPQGSSSSSSQEANNQQVTLNPNASNQCQSTSIQVEPNQQQSSIESQQQACEPKQVVQSVAASSDRRCRLCWCCCCPCSGLSNRNNPSSKEGEQSKSATDRPLTSSDKCQSMPNVSLEKIRSWGDSFDRLMKCPDGRKVFQDFLRCEYSEENILFWIACEELKDEKNPEVVATKARDIYEDYISILSAKEVSLDSRVRDVINNNIKKPTSNIFDEAQLQIYTLMHRDSYPRFINSAMYKKLAQIQTTSRKGSS